LPIFPPPPVMITDLSLKRIKALLPEVMKDENGKLKQMPFGADSFRFQLS
jgi:hypothetical protein